MRSEGIFIDTGAWFALADRDDGHHKEAAAIYPDLLKTYKVLTTSNLVVSETYILILHGLGHSAAVGFLDRVNASPRIVKIHSTEDLEKGAEEILKKYSDQDFSYTDAVSFSIMRRNNIRKVFSFDRHFQAMNFLRLPGGIA